MKKYVNKLMIIRFLAFVSLMSSSLLYAPKEHQNRNKIHEVVELPFPRNQTPPVAPRVLQIQAPGLYLEPVIGGNPYDSGSASEVVIEDDEDLPLPPPPVPAKQSQSLDDVGPALPPKSPTRSGKKNSNKVAVLPVSQDSTYSPVVPSKQSQNKKQPKVVPVQAWLPGADGRSASVSSAWSPDIYETEQPAEDKTTIYVEPQDTYTAPQAASPVRQKSNDAVAARCDGTGVHAHQAPWSEDVYDVTAGGAIGTNDHQYTYLERPTGHAYVDLTQEDPYAIAQEGVERVVISTGRSAGLNVTMDMGNNDDLYVVQQPGTVSGESSTDRPIAIPVSFEEIMGSTSDFNDDEENPYLSHAEVVQMVQKSEDPLLTRLKNFWEATFKKSERIGFDDFVTLVEYVKPFESADMMSDQSFQKELESGIQKTKRYIGLLPLKELVRQERMFAHDDHIRSSVLAILKDDPKNHPFLAIEINKYILEKNHLAFLSDSYIKSKSRSFKDTLTSLVAYIDQAALCIAKLHRIRVGVLCSEIRHKLEQIIRDYDSKKMNKEACVKDIKELVKAAGKQDVCMQTITDTLKTQSPKLYQVIKPKKPWWKKIF